MGDGAFLVFPQGNGRIHAAKSDMAAIILTGTGGVHFFVVLAHQSLAALRVSPDPVPKGFPDSLLFWAAKVVSLAFSTRRSFPSASSMVS